MLLYGYRFEHKRTRSKAPIQQKQISKMGCRGAVSPGLFHRPVGETWVGNGEEGCQFHQPTHEVAGCLSILATASLSTSRQGGYWIWIKRKRKILRKQVRNQSAFLTFLISAQGCFQLSWTAWPVSVTTCLCTYSRPGIAFLENESCRGDLQAACWPRPFLLSSPRDCLFPQPPPALHLIFSSFNFVFCLTHYN